jgi:hypothetical protein
VVFGEVDSLDNRKQKENDMKKNIGIRFCIFAVGIVFLAMVSGCAVSSEPKVKPMSAKAISKIKGQGTIAIVNNQPDKTVRDFGRAGFGTLQGDLNTWTEAAVVPLRETAEKAGLKVQPDGEKSILVSVVDVQLGVSGVEFVAALAKGNVRVKVETGDGYVKEYEGEKNAINPPQACEKALTVAVENIFKDERIVAYLRQ